jgi:hypothetical protein
MRNRRKIGPRIKASSKKNEPQMNADQASTEELLRNPGNQEQKASASSFPGFMGSLETTAHDAVGLV